MRTASSQNVLAILASILLLAAPHLAAAALPDSHVSELSLDKTASAQGETRNGTAILKTNGPIDAANMIYVVRVVGRYQDQLHQAEYVSNETAPFYLKGNSQRPIQFSIALPPGVAGDLGIEVQAPPPPPPTCSITFDNNPIAWGGKTVIHWSSTRAAVFYINSIGYVAGSGSVNVSPLGTTDYSGHVNDAADGSGQAGQCAANLVVTGGQCPEGQFLRAGVCVSQCPVGYTFQNGSCVFTACPAGYIKDASNKCVLSTACTTPPHCEANDLVDSCTGETIRTCDWGCAGGACKAIPAPSATLKAVPLLVHSGDVTTVSWTSFNTDSCNVHGTNGDSWTGISSTGHTSSPILGQTTSTLHCEGNPSANPPFIDKSVTVNIIPTFNEQ